MATAQTMNQRVVALGVSLIQRITGHQGEGRDVTDPRELYAILALADAKREQTSLAAPLSQDDSPSPRSDNDMNTRFVDFSPRRQGRRRHLSPLRPDYHRSMEMLESYRANMPAMGLMKHSSSLDDLTKTKQDTNRDKNQQDVIDGQGGSVFLPEIECKNRVTFQNHASGKPRRKSQVSTATSGVGKREQFAAHSQKGYSEWLSGTSHGLNGFQLQKSILERLRLRDVRNEKSKPTFPKVEPNKLDLRAYDKYPNQYWELRSESLHQPQDLESDMIDRERYRLKQKSALNLKVVDQDKCDRRHRDLSPTGQQEDIVNSSPKKRARQKPRPQSVAPSLSEPSENSPFSDLIIGPIVESSACMPWIENQDLAPPNSRKAQQRPPYFLTDENVSKELRAEIRQRHQSPKGEVGTSVVNISIQHDTPKKRNPKHIEETLVKQQEIRQCDSVKDTACAFFGLPNENGQLPKADQAQGKELHSFQVSRGKRQNQHKQKALLQGFKKIEVFGEHKQNSRSNDNEVVLKVADEPKKYMPRCHPPIYKLDMRNYPPQGNANATMDNKNDRETNAALDDRSDDDSKKMCNSRSVKIVDGTIILKHVKDTDDTQETATGTANKESEEIKENSVR